MNNTMKKIIDSEYRRLFDLVIIFIFSLVISAVVFVLTGQDTMTNINYENIRQLSFLTVFLRMLKRNLFCLLSLICLTCLGKSKIINCLFAIISVYYGLSIIYLVRTIQLDKIYFVLTFADYFVFFPLLFYFTYISSVISKYSKKTKKIETISYKFDIIMSSYMKLAFTYILIVIAYSLSYSYYIIILSRLLVD